MLLNNFATEFVSLFTGMHWVVALLLCAGIALCIIEAVVPGFGIFGIFGILSAIGGVTGLFGPVITQTALDEAIPNKDVQLLFLLVAMLCGTFILSIIFTTIRSKIMINVSQNIIYDIRKDIFGHLQRYRYLFAFLQDECYVNHPCCTC